MASENAVVSAKLNDIGHHESDYVEHLCFHPNGPAELEQIVCRATLNELNALIEVALQELLQKSGSFFIEEKGCFAIGANRDVLLNELKKNGVKVAEFPEYDKLLEIKELSEGFKHRQRLQPLPRFKNKQWRTPDSAFPVPVNQQLHPYDISLSDVSRYLIYVRKFLEHCNSGALI